MKDRPTSDPLKSISDEKDQPKSDEPKSEETDDTIKDSWDATSSEDESTEEPTKPPRMAAASKQSAQQQKSESSDESDDESSSDDSGGSEAESEAEETRTDAEIKREKAWQRIMVGQCFINLLKTLLSIWNFVIETSSCGRTEENT